MAMRSQFITLEGGEAAGKSTQIEKLKARLIESGQSVLVTREPGGTPLGESIRHLLKHAPEGQGMCPETELLLFLASRAELVRKVIAPALASGTWVLSDRFFDSTTVYQGAGRRLPTECVAQLNAFAVELTRPGLTLVLDLPPDVARQRRFSRQQTRDLPDRMEAEAAEFYERVRQGYLNLAEIEPGRVRLIPSQGTIEDTFNLIWKEVSDAFSL